MTGLPPEHRAISKTLVSEQARYRSATPVNAMSVDVEDYFQVSAFEGQISRGDWSQYPIRISQNIERTLELFDRGGVRATFFTLGWIAERYPHLIRKISEAGHEIASHGYGHVRVTGQTPEQFREDVTRTKGILEDIVGARVLGYRAASYSIGADNLWALDVLEEADYRYSSSIYPIRHDHYGMPQAPRFAFRLRQEGLLEIPVTTVSICGRNFPCGGGGYFRLLPYQLFRWALRRVNGHDEQSGVFYFHPWEIDPAQPRVPGLGLKTRFRHYFNLGRMEARIEKLMRDFRWDRMDRVFALKRS